MRAIFLGLVLTAAACGGGAGESASSAVEPATAGGGSAGAPAIGEAGAPTVAPPVDPNAGKLMHACKANGACEPIGSIDFDPIIGCYQGICSFPCGANGRWDSLAAYCANLGGQCQGDASGVVTCQ